MLEYDWTIKNLENLGHYTKVVITKKNWKQCSMSKKRKALGSEQELVHQEFQQFKTHVVRIYLPSLVKKEWVDGFRHCVEQASKMAYLGSLFVNFYVQQWVQEDREEKFGDNFIRHCFAAVCQQSNETKSQTVFFKEVVHKWRDMISGNGIRHKDLPNSSGIGQVLTTTSNQYKVSFKNYNYISLKQHMKRYFKYIHEESSPVAAWLTEKMFKAIGGKKRVKDADDEEGEDIEEGEEDDLLKLDAKDLLRATEILEFEVENSKFNLATLEGRIRYHHHILACLEEHNTQILPFDRVRSQKKIQKGEQYASKLFTIAPMCTNSLHFISWDLKTVVELHAYAKKVIKGVAQKKMKSSPQFLQWCKNLIMKTPAPPASIFDVFSNDGLKRRGDEMFWRGRRVGASHKTDGVQLHVQLLEEVTSHSYRTQSEIIKSGEAYKKRKLEGRKNNDGTVDARTLKEGVSRVKGSWNGLSTKPFAVFGSEEKVVTFGKFGTESVLQTAAAYRNVGGSDFHWVPSFVAVDPGVKNLATVVRIDRTTSNKHFKKENQFSASASNYVETSRVSSDMYYHLIGNAERKRRLLHRKYCSPNIQRNEDAMSIHNLKSSKLRLIYLALSVSLKCWLTQFTFYGSRNAARARFSYDIKKMKTRDDIIGLIAPNRSSVVVLGDAAFPSSLRGNKSTPMGAITKLMCSKRRVIKVNEFRTTKRCSHCQRTDIPPAVKDRGSDLTGLHLAYMATLDEQKELRKKDKSGVYRRDADGNFIYGRRSTIHGLMQCRNCNRMWNRDVNAAINIGMVFESLWRHGIRPLHLQSDEKTGPTPRGDEAGSCVVAQDVPRRAYKG